MKSEYDNNKLKEARKCINEIYEYHYGYYGTKREWKRLETIINKIDELLNMGSENDAEIH